MTQPVVVEWDATALPAELRAMLPTELRELPPGGYIMEPVVDDDELTDKEEAESWKPLPSSRRVGAFRGIRLCARYGPKNRGDDSDLVASAAGHFRGIRLHRG